MFPALNFLFQTPTNSPFGTLRKDFCGMFLILKNEKISLRAGNSTDVEPFNKIVTPSRQRRQRDGQRCSYGQRVERRCKGTFFDLLNECKSKAQITNFILNLVSIFPKFSIKLVIWKR